MKNSIPYYLFANVLVLSACTGLDPKEVKKRPNILFIMADDHAYQAISAYDSSLTKTPHIDRLAKEGILFKNSCVTNSISAPSRAVILTGKHSHINGKIDNLSPFDTNQITFPQILQQNGYQTAMFGKLHFGNNPKGFDEFKILPDQGNYYNPDFICKKEGNIKVEGYVTDIITQMTLNWLKKQRDPNKPFLLMCLHKAPHPEWFPDKTQFSKFTKKRFKEPSNLFDNFDHRGMASKKAEMSILKNMNWAGDSKIYPSIMDELKIFETCKWDKIAFEKEINRMNAQQRASWDSVYLAINENFRKEYAQMNQKELMQWRYQRYMQDYLACIGSVDESVGQILDYLDQAGLSENTIVVYTSDQGFYLGEHGWFDKRFIYNQSFKTPLLIRWPNVIKAGISNEEMVQNLDFAQTFLEAASIVSPSDMQGKSLFPIFRGEGENFREAAYYHYYEYPGIHAVKRHYGIVTKKYKLIHFYYDIDEWELYDLKNDPNEMNSVYHQLEYNSIRDSLKKQLVELRIKYKDSEELDKKFISKIKI